MAANKGGGTQWYIAIGALAILGILYFLFIANKEYNWSENYEPLEDYPYGISVFKNLVEKAHPQQDFVEITDSVYHRIDLDTLPFGSNYFLVGRELYLDSLEMDFMFDYVGRGNNAFFVSHRFDYQLIDTLLDVTTEDYYYYDFDTDGFAITSPIQKYQDTSVFVGLRGAPGFANWETECKYVRNHQPLNKVWHYFSDDIVAKSGNQIEILGTFEEYYVNYIRIPHGEGFFYLHATPLAFTNYSLLKDSGFQYVAQAAAFTGPGTNIWDNYNRKYQYVHNENYSNQGGTDYGHDEGPLAFILSERSLKWAWFAFLAFILIYMIFGAKRKQRSIPVIHPLKNTSLDFAETIGTMFRMENDHGKLLRLKMRLFRAFVRERYGLKTSVEQQDEAELIERLAEKADLHPEQVDEVFSMFNEYNQQKELEALDLVKFHQKLEQFYQNAR
ncbi:MAG: hypothetical protein P8O93_00595 [Flavobacteriaceae bacterium]|nr:hypothetical protein [Flavobacteriaceae bacterium]MDG1779840.1 hypothetical protein [Flavobacteriales bacterium]MDG2246982.1 hypothetical protein [Flavobacteriales bacterium]